MNSHKNARTTFAGCKLLIGRIRVAGMMPAAEAAGISVRTARKWLNRLEELGEPGLPDRSSRPSRTRATIDDELRTRIEPLRRWRMPMRTIAGVVGRSVATISNALVAAGLSRLTALDPAKPVVRYKPSAPSELLHTDTNKLGCIERPSNWITGNRRDASRGAGWEVARVAIDDHSRAGFVQMYAENARIPQSRFSRPPWQITAIGVQTKRLIPDNASAYCSRLFTRTCKALGIKHSFTRPCRPQTNGMVERFNGRIEQVLRSHHFNSSEDLEKTLLRYVWLYNQHLPQKALNHEAPIQAMKRWQQSHPHLFQKSVRNHPGPDN